MNILYSVLKCFGNHQADDKPAAYPATNIPSQYYVYIQQSRLLDHPPPDLWNYSIATIKCKNEATIKYFPKGCRLYQTQFARKNEELVRVAVKLKAYLATCSNEDLARRFREENIHSFLANGDISKKRSLKVQEIIEAQKLEKVKKE